VVIGVLQLTGVTTLIGAMGIAPSAMTAFTASSTGSLIAVNSKAKQTFSKPLFGAAFVFVLGKNPSSGSSDPEKPLE
jgi:hypothetical protein